MSSRTRTLLLKAFRSLPEIEIGQEIRVARAFAEESVRPHVSRSCHTHPTC